LGIGLPYLNSENLPFAKQLFVGGASSLRGFQFRSVGPGSYSNPNDEEDSFFDQTGDLMLEWNAEVRFDLGGYLNGAVFLDAGNVWLINESETRPGGAFQFRDFGRELAVSSGVGLRIDIEFVVLRFDLGIPLRDPSRLPDNAWLFEEMSIDPDWTTENLVLNVAIGYPF
jgi:outer membrane protein assembly factor BamA